MVPPGYKFFHCGSSPRARGQPKGPPLELKCRRIIPACAGSTRASSRSIWRDSDHPRVRGVNNPREPRSAGCLGSSPRARGQPDPEVRAVLVPRIIPACAGSTISALTHASTHSDHPRVRGVNLPPETAESSGIGSSPRARGQRKEQVQGRYKARIIPACAGSTQGDPAALPPAPRIIPACAGSTTSTELPVPLLADHPRVRGVNSRKNRC